MDDNAENRREQRLSYRCPVWCGDEITQVLFPGLMEDVSSGGLGFTYQADQGHLQRGQRLTIRFSLPRFNDPDPQATVGVTRTGLVRWARAASGGVHRVGLQFDKPLSLRPAEEAALTALRRDR